MELILKLPKDKPPFIGILFYEEDTARTLNEDYLDPYHGVKTFSINIEPLADSLHLRLACSSPVGIRFYRHVRYDRIKLEKWLQAVKYIKCFNFSHLVIASGKEAVVRSKKQNRLFVIPVQAVTVFN